MLSVGYLALIAYIHPASMPFIIKSRIRVIEGAPLRRSRTAFASSLLVLPLPKFQLCGGFNSLQRRPRRPLIVEGAQLFAFTLNAPPVPRAPCVRVSYCLSAGFSEVDGTVCRESP